MLGWFTKGNPSSEFLSLLHGGGGILGKIDSDLNITGDGIYVYPDWHTALVGKWENGEMVDAIEGEIDFLEFKNRIPNISSVKKFGRSSFYYDTSTETR